MYNVTKLAVDCVEDKMSCLTYLDTYPSPFFPSFRDEDFEIMEMQNLDKNMVLQSPLNNNLDQDIMNVHRLNRVIETLSNPLKNYMYE